MFVADNVLLKACQRVEDYRSNDQPIFQRMPTINALFHAGETRIS